MAESEVNKIPGRLGAPEIWVKLGPWRGPFKRPSSILRELASTMNTAGETASKVRSAMIAEKRFEDFIEIWLPKLKESQLVSSIEWDDVHRCFDITGRPALLEGDGDVLVKYYPRKDWISLPAAKRAVPKGLLLIRKQFLTQDQEGAL